MVKLGNLERRDISSITFHNLASNLIKQISINTFSLPILKSLLMQINLSDLTEVTCCEREASVILLKHSSLYLSLILRIHNNVDMEPTSLSRAGNSSFLFVQGLQKKTKTL